MYDTYITHIYMLHVRRIYDIHMMYVHIDILDMANIVTIQQQRQRQHPRSNFFVTQSRLKDGFG